MITTWVFLILLNGAMTEVGGFDSESTCEATRKEIVIQRTNLGYGRDSTVAGKPYIMAEFIETTKCYKVWKK